MKINTLVHGRETYVTYYQDFVLKHPLPTLGDDAKLDWLLKQHNTKDAIDAISQIGNPAYNIPRMHFINDDELQVLEERAPGAPLTRDLYRTLTRRQQYEIIHSLASFLVDMNESRPVLEPQSYKICNELKFGRLKTFIDTKMSNWFTKNEVRQMARIYDEIGAFEYTTRPAWSHRDLNPGNVYYDPQTSKLSFIDFAEAGYQFIYRDIFASLQIELDICKRVYETYNTLHNKSLYQIPSPKNDTLRDIMKYRIMVVFLKRFIKAADDLRANPKNQKSENNNRDKVAFMRDTMQNIRILEQQFCK
ncbi:MAG: phosphotransferase [Muribaculaceae bacterium]|nr:phosphotransferase [Muribaculaceae bacterium]